MLSVAVNETMFDWPWSAIHLLSGLLLGFGLSIIFRRWTARKFWLTGLSLVVAWELFEGVLRYLDANVHEAIAPFKNAVAGFAFAVESPTNIIGDLLIGSIGLVLGRFLVFPSKAGKVPSPAGSPDSGSVP